MYLYYDYIKQIKMVFIYIKHNPQTFFNLGEKYETHIGAVS